MTLMNQGDVFKYLMQILNITQQVMIDDILSEICTIDASTLSNITRQRVNGREDFRSKSDKIYEKVKLCALNKNIDFNYVCSMIRNEVQKDGLSVNGSDVFKSEPNDAWFKHMLKASLPNIKCRNPKKRASLKSNLTQDLKLRNQNIIADTNFIGRTEIISSIKRELDGRHIIALTGDFCIGKSAAARQYAVKYKENYSCIQEVKLDNPAYITPHPLQYDSQVFKVMTSKLIFDNDKLNLNNSGIKEDFDFKFQALKNLNNLDEKPALIIYDDVDQPAEDIDVLYEIIKNANVHVIITTRLLNFAENKIFNLKIPALDEREQLKLFMYHFNNNFNNLNDLNAEDEELIKKILAYGEGNTLYIEHIAKFIDAYEYTFKEAFDILRSNNAFPDEFWTSRPQSSINTFINILFHNKVTDLRKEVLKKLAEIPEICTGVSRREIVKAASDASIQKEILALEAEGYIKKIKTDNRNETRMHRMIRDIVLSAF